MAKHEKEHLVLIAFIYYLVTAAEQLAVGMSCHAISWLKVGTNTWMPQFVNVQLTVSGDTLVLIL